MKRKTIIAIGVIIVLFLTTVISIVLVKNSKKNDDASVEDQKALKERENLINNAPYTLDELYAMIEDPLIIEKLTKPSDDGKGQIAPNDFYYEIFHFYNYFSKSTPFKRVKKGVKKDGKIIELKEFEYITYDQFMKEVEDSYSVEEDMRKKWIETYGDEVLKEGPVRGFLYSDYVDSLLYGSAQYEER